MKNEKNNLFLTKKEILNLKNSIEIFLKSTTKEVEEEKVLNYFTSIEKFNFKGRGLILTTIHELKNLLNLLKEQKETKKTFLYQNLMKSSWDNQFSIKLISINKRLICLNKFMDQLNNFSNCTTKYDYSLDINSFQDLIKEIDISEFMKVGEQVNINFFLINIVIVC